MAHDPDKRGIQVARAHRSGVIDSDNVEDGEECDKDDDIDYESEIGDLPSLTDVFLRGDSGFKSADLSCKAATSPAPVDRTGKECCCEGDCGNSGNPIATTAAGIQLGASQGESWRSHVVVHPADILDTATSDDRNSTFEVADLTPPSGPFPTLSGGFAEPDTEGVKDAPGSLAKYNTRDPVGE
ncbi:uncharacterized protein Z518_10108 [Rhinocladiella mackenziei CBS 650.93]|uniref:Uncharacterized protein n=1 Tax=Rhinocladiella mackenziei CBS 650.93 TaxID=1442369 RepID=A0A0D2FGE3_9EURO|nr:uncharacterized protein Z518_10108 [Rhinocladiella mackenziei CBS 650.93]KIX01042.1 hypothetical protein Z518_10108 [Rhinocladiella mackenziei CBS 650.93]